MSVGIETVVTHHDLSLVRNMRSDSGDAGKSAHGIAAVEILLDDILDHRTEVPVLPLEPVLIFS